MWENAASLCFITNAKAKQEKLRGVKVNLSIVKLGGQNEKIETMKYKLPLLDKQGHTVEFELYGINKITSDIEQVDVENRSAKQLTCLHRWYLLPSDNLRSYLQMPW